MARVTRLEITLTHETTLKDLRVLLATVLAAITTAPYEGLYFQCCSDPATLVFAEPEAPPTPEYLTNPNMCGNQHRPTPARWRKEICVDCGHPVNADCHLIREGE